MSPGIYAVWNTSASTIARFLFTKSYRNYRNFRYTRNNPENKLIRGGLGTTVREEKDGKDIDQPWGYLLISGLQLM